MLSRLVTRWLALAALCALMAGCGARYELRVENGYPFPVEVLSGSVGGRDSRQADPIGTVPAHGSRTFQGSHPFVAEGTALTVTTEDGRVLANVRAGVPATGYAIKQDGRRSVETLAIGPATGSAPAPDNR